MKPVAILIVLSLAAVAADNKKQLTGSAEAGNDNADFTATAFLEPFLDEYRLATLFGVSLGMLRATVTSMGQGPRLPAWRLEARAGTGGEV